MPILGANYLAEVQIHLAATGEGGHCTHLSADRAGLSAQHDTSVLESGATASPTFRAGTPLA